MIIIIKCWEQTGLETTTIPNTPKVHNSKKLTKRSATMSAASVDLRSQPSLNQDHGGADNMPLFSKAVSITFLVISGIASVAVTLFGAFAGLWGGSKTPYPVLFVFFWGLPALSLPTFGAYFVNRKLGIAVATLLAIGIYITLFLLSWHGCVEGQCNTTNMVGIALGPFTWLGHLWGQVIAALFLTLASLKRQETTHGRPNEQTAGR
jgi:hypothetical protein